MSLFLRPRPAAPPTPVIPPPLATALFPGTCAVGGPPARSPHTSFSASTVPPRPWWRPAPNTVPSSIRIPEVRPTSAPLPPMRFPAAAPPPVYVVEPPPAPSARVPAEAAAEVEVTPDTHVDADPERNAAQPAGGASALPAPVHDVHSDTGVAPDADPWPDAAEPEPEPAGAALALALPAPVHDVAPDADPWPDAAEPDPEPAGAALALALAAPEPERTRVPARMEGLGPTNARSVRPTSLPMLDPAPLPAAAVPQAPSPEWVNRLSWPLAAPEAPAATPAPVQQAVPLRKWWKRPTGRPRVGGLAELLARLLRRRVTILVPRRRYVGVVVRVRSDSVTIAAPGPRMVHIVIASILTIEQL